MILITKNFLFLALVSALFGSGSAFAGDFVCRLTLARSGEARMATKGVIQMRGNIGERIGGRDDGTGFRYKIEVVDGKRMSCRGNRRQVLVSLLNGNEQKPFVTGSTCFEPNRDFFVGSSGDHHWIYFQCYSAPRR